MTTPRLSRRSCGALALTVLVSACGPTSSESGTSPSPSSPTSPKPGTASSASPTGSSSPLPDPRSLRGLSEVPELADPVPVEGSHPQHLPATVVDVEKNRVTVTDTSRILALDLYGTLSRTLIGLGLGDRMVGRTVSSTEKQLAKLPVVTENGHSLNVEAVLALKPTLIIADRSVGPREALDQIRRSGVPVVLVDPHRRVESTAALIRSVAAAVGMKEAGEALVTRSNQEIERARALISTWRPTRPLRMVFLYVRGTAGIFFILGSEDGAGELIKGVGGEDVAGEKGIRSVAPANAESLVSLDPEVILVMEEGLRSTGGLKGLLKRAGVSNTTAGRNQRVVAIPDGIALSFGPQTGEVLTAVSRAVHGVNG